MIEEPDVVAPERVFEEAMLAAVHSILRNAGRRYAVVPKFGLDIGLFISDQHGAYARFIEAKSYAGGRPGGIGFGDGRGVGPQVDILLCPEGDSEIIDGSVRWVLADATLEKGAARYALFNCVVARASAMGGACRGKQNNLRISQLAKNYRTWRQLMEDVSAFLLRDGPSTSSSSGRAEARRPT